MIAAGVLADACMGAGYAFSVFKAGLIEALHCTPQQALMGYRLSFLFLPVGMLLGGVISRRLSPRVAVVIGGVMFGVGVMGAGLVQSVHMLWVTYGVLVSVGNGIVYATVIAVSVRWFPDRKGMASGTVVAALGVGTLVIALVGQRLVGALGAQEALRYLGAAFLAASLIASRFIADPPKDYSPAGWTAPAGQSGSKGNDATWREMLATPVFWVMFATYICGAAPGLLVIGEAKDVAVDLTKLGAMLAATMVGMMGAANSAGRLLWGAVSDRMGRLNVLCAIMILNAIVMSLLGVLMRTEAGLVAGFVVTGLCYGGCLGTFPSLCADRFGSRNMEVNYALLFCAFGLAAMVTWFAPAPVAGNASLQAYQSGFDLCAGLAVAGVVLSIGMRLVRRSP